MLEPMRLTSFWRWIALLAGGLCIGCSPAISNVSSLAGPQPFFSDSVDGVSHNIYRDTTFETVSATIESGSVDSINFNATFDPFCIAIVDADLSVVRASKFTTSFELSDGSQYNVDWVLANDKTEGVGRGVFLVPGNTMAASTSVLEEESGER